MMQIALYFLRACWKPLVILALVAMVYSAGFTRAKRACNADNLKAGIAELKRRLSATATVLQQAARDSEARTSEIETLTKKVDAYESSIQADKGTYCALSDADARRLRDIR